LSVRSNLDRVIADRLRAVAGEELAAAEAKVRARVDSLVEEKSAPVRARIAELRTEGERRVADGRARLDTEKRKLEEQLKALTGGLVGLPKLP
jgi:F0F1-type ATP synthase membrane subunit b/b'